MHQTIPRSAPALVQVSLRSLLLGAVVAVSPVHADQSLLPIQTRIEGPVLRFDWPALEIGVGSYEAGPTGLTIFRFPNKASAVVDVRGGAPGTVNTDLLRLGYPSKLIDAIVFSGGSAYGEEAITAVMTGLKDDGIKSGNWNNIALASGAIIYDFLGHRINEVYPDKRLAQAALHDLRPGVFPLGAQGAGRMAMQGGFFGCGAHSGQGGAFRQIGETKIATFVVINALGAITDRSGRMVTCHRHPDWGGTTQTSDLIARAAMAAGSAPSGTTSNTTVSLVVTNRRMSPGDLQRLAVQVHTSMARGIQPFSTYDDGDTLFALSTQEIGDGGTRPSLGALDSIAAETMWDAVLASVPVDDQIAPRPVVGVAPEKLARLVGRYRLGPNAILETRLDNGTLFARLLGPAFFDLGSDLTPLQPESDDEFRVRSRYSTLIAFGPGERAATVTVNPGRWGQHGERIPD